ncbi:MAG: VOC family protein [Rudaea sp.]|nr:VOC family protein [Rudaea sp.]
MHRQNISKALLSQCLLAALISTAGAASALAATPLHFPALVQPASNEHHAGKVILVELVTPDIAASKQFYSGLFNWAFDDIQSGDAHYAAASLDGRPVAGLIQKSVKAGEQRQPAWLTFISVRDVDAARAAAAQHGAKVLFEPHTLADRGREAVFADPQGAVFAVLASSSGDPPDELAAPGEWIWSSLITSDPDKDAAFYQALTDYEVFDITDADGPQEHLQLASDNYARASVNSFPLNRPDMHAHWLNFVRVDDVAKASAKVTALGGRVIVEPREDRHGGKIAVVADPQGAHFGLMEWSDADSKQVTK